jgi:hypothetical protein
LILLSGWMVSPLSPSSAAAAAWNMLCLQLSATTRHVTRTRLCPKRILGILIDTLVNSHNIVMFVSDCEHCVKLCVASLPQDPSVHRFVGVPASPAGEQLQRILKYYTGSYMGQLRWYTVTVVPKVYLPAVTGSTGIMPGIGTGPERSCFRPATLPLRYSASPRGLQYHI